MHEDLSERALEANLITYNSAISACEKAGEWQQALELLSTLQEIQQARTQ